MTQTSPSASNPPAEPMGDSGAGPPHSDEGSNHRAPRPDETTVPSAASTNGASADDGALERLIQSVAARQPSGPSEPLWWVFNFLVPVAILVAGVAAVIALGEVEPGQRPAPDQSRNGRLQALPPLRTARLQSLASTGKPLHLTADGEVVPYREAELAAEVAGRIIEKTSRCESGQYVRAGELLMIIDPTDYEIQVEQLSRSQEQAYEALREVDQETANTNRLIEVAEEDLALQQKELKRQRSMPAGFASQKEIDVAAQAFLNARQSLLTLQNQLETQRAKRTRLEASEKLAASQLRAANINLERTRILAPIDGVIVREDADVNTFVNRGTVLVVIESTEKVEVDSNLRNDQLYWVLNQPGVATDLTNRGYQLPVTPAIIQYELSGLENQVYRWKGNLVSYDGIGLDPATRTVPVRIVVDEPRQNVDADGNPISAVGAPALVRGMFVTVQLLIKPTAELVVVPADAMQPGNRIYEFVPDESVLTTPVSVPGGDQVADPAAQDPENQATESSGSPEDTTNDPPSENASDDAAPSPTKFTSPTEFDPDQWVPGRVVVRNQIVPVDSLTLGSSSASEDSTSAAPTANRGLADSRTYWVCEAATQSVGDGSWVVVSPLGDLPPEGIAARAPASNESSQISPTDSPSPTTSD